MTNPEIEYSRLVSGDAAAIRTRAEDLHAALSDLVSVRSDLVDAQGLPRAGRASQPPPSPPGPPACGEVSTTRVAVERARGALETAAGSYDTAVDQADYFIGFWRNRPGALPPVIE